MAADEGDADLRENRFSYLLQPIRDLASNWDVNIAAELEEYLEELEGLSFSIQDCGPGLNFAEAALLIQGTTCVYSKKVEHLYNLVYQALETIFNKRSKERAAAQRRADRAADADGGGHSGGGDDDDDDFLALDERMLQEGEDIDLEEDADAAPVEVLRAPTALLALDDAEAGAAAAMGGGEGGEAGAFRLAQCGVHASGALLLEMRDGDMYDAQLAPRRRGGRGMMGGGAGLLVLGGGVNGGGGAVAGGDLGGEGAFAAEAWGGGAAEGAGVGGWDCGDEGDGGWDGGYDDDDGNDGGAVEDIDLPDAGDFAHGNEQHSAQDEQQQQQQQQQQEAQEEELGGSEQLLTSEQLQQQGAGAGVDALGAAAGPVPFVARSRRGGAAAAGGKGQQQGQGRFFDPYAPLDPADRGTLPIKPMQVRKPKHKPRPQQQEQQQQAALGSTPSRHASQAAKLLAFPEFAYMLQRLEQLQRNQAAAARKLGATHARRGALLQPQSVMDWADAAALQQQEAAAMQEEDGEQQTAPVDALLDAGAGWGGDVGNTGIGGGGASNDYDDDDGGEPGGPSGWDLEDAAGAPHWGSGAGAEGGGPTADAERMTYEELCRAHIDSLMAAAAAQQVQSDLQVRVSTWRQRIDPVLRAEEDRSAFDIHHYGERILSSLSSAGACHDADANNAPQEQEQQAQGQGAGFGAMLAGAAAGDRQEVSRLFAAMLQLVNNSNVAICKPPAAEGEEGVPAAVAGGSRRGGASAASAAATASPDAPFVLKLLSTDMRHHHMGEMLNGEGSAAAATVTAAVAGADAGARGASGSRGVVKGGGKASGAKGSAASQQQRRQGAAVGEEDDWPAEEGEQENRRQPATKKPAAKKARRTKAAAS